MKKPEINTARMGDKMFVMNGVDPISYVNLANIHRKWWQIWKRRIRIYPKTRYAIYYRFSQPKPRKKGNSNE